MASKHLWLVCGVLIGMALTQILTFMFGFGFTLSTSQEQEHQLSEQQQNQVSIPIPVPQQHQEQQQNRYRVLAESAQSADRICEEHAAVYSGTKGFVRKEWNKVVSFSIFPMRNSTRVFDWVIHGAFANVLAARIYYPDWAVRFYVSDAIDWGEIEPLLNCDYCQAAQVVKCKHQTDREIMYMYRNYVADDPTAEYWIIRDIDSRLNIRDLLAVNDWISSGLPFHAIRDNPLHGIAILAGMFGGTRGCFGPNNTMESLMNLVIESRKAGKITAKSCGGTKLDQCFLSKYIWPIVKTQTLSTDSSQGMYCRNSAACHKFPVDPKFKSSFFVGQPFKDTRHWLHLCNISCLVETTTTESEDIWLLHTLGYL
ncbi:tetratricopeptide repeat protein [Pelomyxa schiedti]|nr:tetratricopeptide repeat protein [Pelomyxa schiedti]